MVLGYRKVATDAMFAKIVHRLYKSDIFSKNVLLDVDRSNNIYVLDLVLDDTSCWRWSLCAKYRPVVAITNLNVLIH